MAAEEPRRHRLRTLLAWSYPFALAALWLAFRLVGERWWVLVPLLYLPSVLFAAPLPIFLFALRRARPRRILLSQLAALLLVLFPLSGLHLSPTAHPHDARAIRVMTFNVWYLRRGEAAVLDEIRAASPNVVLIQAAPGRRTPHAEMLRYFSDGWYLDAWGDFFLASRFPILGVYHPPSLPGSTVPSAFAGYTLDIDGPIDFYTTHPFSPRDGLEELRSGALDEGTRRTVERNTELRRRQIEALVARAQQSTNPVVIAGDTNLPGASFFFRRYLGAYRDAFDEAGRGFGYTFPANRVPWMRIDRVLVGAGLEVRRVEVGGRHGSDHCPVIAEIARTR